MKKWRLGDPHRISFGLTTRTKNWSVLILTVMFQMLFPPSLVVFTEHRACKPGAYMIGMCGISKQTYFKATG